MIRKVLFPLDRGFTLLELMIVIVIMAIIFTIGFNNFQDYTRQQQLVSAVRSTTTAIRSAQASALTGTKPSTCMAIDGSTPPKVIDHLTGYLFNVIPPDKYRIDLSCTVTGLIKGTEVTIPAGNTISVVGTNPVIFKSLGQGTNIPAGGLVTITINQTVTGNSKTITIGENGNIQ